MIKINAVYAAGNDMPGVQCNLSLQQNRFTRIAKGKDVKEQDQYKRPWYTLIPHC